MRASAFVAVSMAARVAAFSARTSVGVRLSPVCGSARLFAQGAYRGPMQERVEVALQAAFSPSYLEVRYLLTLDTSLGYCDPS